MTGVPIELVRIGDGEVLVHATTLSRVLRSVATEVTTWTRDGADPPTLRSVRDLLERLADRIDADCVTLASDLDDER